MADWLRKFRSILLRCGDAGPLSRLVQCSAIGVVVVAVGSYYLWELRAAGYRFDWVHDQSGYYNYLGRAFAHGQLELPIKPSPKLLAVPNPWDPAVDDSYKMHDMALFKGRYYLYHGPGPAVILFTPWLLITGHDLSERFALVSPVFRGLRFFVWRVDTVACPRGRENRAAATRTHADGPRSLPIGTLPSESSMGI